MHTGSNGTRGVAVQLAQNGATMADGMVGGAADHKPII